MYTGISSGVYTGASFDQVKLLHSGRLWIPYSSTYTVTASSVVADGVAGDELRVDGQLNTPASLTISSYTLTISSFSSMPALTYLDIGYAAGFNLGGSTQTPVVNLSSITVENNGLLTHWANSTTAAGKSIN